MWYWIFYKETTNQFFILKDDQVTGDVRWQLHRDGYDVLWDSARSYHAASKEAKEVYHLKPLRLETRPISFRKASEFVKDFHRHHIPPQGNKFSIALYDGETVIGVIISGRPVSRYKDDGLTLEVTRCCVKHPYKNGISILYSAVCRVAEAMGYKRVITYTLAEEPGVSMRASNFQLEKVSEGGSWNSRSRKRIDKHPTGKKCLWTKEIG
ncbi:XF1762 family protein [Virgibacillus halodenitrificans]|uniref:XF1762 family protein n=1 Tax=Virgibacillus halodenitrificans TaxID=1482 RepID=UPI001F09C828|nr:XF1762 family protein [Virgibacillus halodenitrificans]